MISRSLNVLFCKGMCEFKINRVAFHTSLTRNSPTILLERYAHYVIFVYERYNATKHLKPLNCFKINTRRFQKYKSRKELYFLTNDQEKGQSQHLNYYQFFSLYYWFLVFVHLNIQIKSYKDTHICLVFKCR